MAFPGNCRPRSAEKTLAAPAAAVVLLLVSAGCAAHPDHALSVDPLKQRLLAREEAALENLRLDRAPVYAYTPSAGGGGRLPVYSYLDAPYDGPPVEPPLPDLNLLPEDLPPWGEAAP